MKGQFALVLDEDLSGVAHEFAASELDLLVEGGGEHHDLFAMRCLLEDVLDVRAHVYSKSQLGRVQILSHFSKKDTYRHSREPYRTRRG